MAEARHATDAAREAFAHRDRGQGYCRSVPLACWQPPRPDRPPGLVDARRSRIVVEFNQVAEDSFLGYSELVTAPSDRPGTSSPRSRTTSCGVMSNSSTYVAETDHRPVCTLRSARRGDRPPGRGTRRRSRMPPWRNTEALQIHYETSTWPGDRTSGRATTRGSRAQPPASSRWGRGSSSPASSTSCPCSTPSPSIPTSYGFIDDVSDILQARPTN